MTKKIHDRAHLAKLILYSKTEINAVEMNKEKNLGFNMERSQTDCSSITLDSCLHFELTLHALIDLQPCRISRYSFDSQSENYCRTSEGASEL